MANLDFSLYLVTSRELLKGRDLVQEVKKAVKGGVTMVQLREKTASSREFYDLALALKNGLQGTGIPLIINDRLDIAMAVDADGLHVGQDDLPLPVARKIWGAGKIIGLSVNTLAEARQAEHLGADYLGAGPVFATPTKPDAEQPIGPGLLRELKDNIKVPVIAIGGINEQNLVLIKQAGADGAAVVSALMEAADIEQASRRMLSLWKSR